MFYLYHPAALSLSFSHRIGGENAMKNIIDYGWGDHSPLMITGRTDLMWSFAFTLLDRQDP